MIRWMHRVRRRTRRGERGQAALEFVLLFPYVLILIFLMAEMAIALLNWNQIEHATREGARYAAVGSSQTDVINRTVDRSNGILTTSNVTVTNAQGTSGSDVTVAATYNYTIRTPLGNIVHWLTGGTVPGFTMTASTKMRIE